jgi:hypothetical protein
MIQVTVSGRCRRQHNPNRTTFRANAASTNFTRPTYRLLCDAFAPGCTAGTGPHSRMVMPRRSAVNGSNLEDWCPGGCTPCRALLADGGEGEARRGRSGADIAILELAPRNTPSAGALCSAGRGPSLDSGSAAGRGRWISPSSPTLLRGLPGGPARACLHTAWQRTQPAAPSDRPDRESRCPAHRQSFRSVRTRSQSRTRLQAGARSDRQYHDAATATHFIAQCQLHLKQAEVTHTQEKALFLRGGRAVDALFKRRCERLSAALTPIAARLRSYRDQVAVAEGHRDKEARAGAAEENRPTRPPRPDTRSACRRSWRPTHCRRTRRFRR